MVHLNEETISLTKKLLKYPFSRILMITIRDPQQNTKWLGLSKIRSWLKRYSDDHIIVRGLVGGTHFHLLAGIKPKVNIKPQKGIHFHIVALNEKAPAITFDTPEETQDRLKVIHYRHLRYEDLTRNVHVQRQEHISSIAAMIKAYWKKKTGRIKREQAKSKKELNIVRIINYLQKNLDENESHELYLTHYITP